MEFRIEKDTMGEVKVPQTNIRSSNRKIKKQFQDCTEGSMPIEIIHAFAYLKKAAAHANCELGALTAEKRDLISKVCDEILTGELNDQFPLVIWQTGSGTQSNMNCNEVIANRGHVLQGGTLTDAEKVLNLNDDCNKSQSSNDTYPTAMHIATYKMTHEVTLPGMKKLRDALATKVEEFKDIVKTGRTHLMDATPLTLGQEFSEFTWHKKMEQIYPRGRGGFGSTVTELALGGDSCWNRIEHAKRLRRTCCERRIAEFTGLPLITAENKFEALAAHDAMVELSGALAKRAAVSLMKIGNDVRLLSSDHAVELVKSSFQTTSQDLQSCREK